MGRFFRAGGGWLLKKGGVLKKPVEVLKEFDPLLSTLSVSPNSTLQQQSYAPLHAVNATLLHVTCATVRVQSS